MRFSSEIWPYISAAMVLLEFDRPSEEEPFLLISPTKGVEEAIAEANSNGGGRIL